jgi:pimeloyl-ACP methyl ester carboxylesterase
MLVALLFMVIQVLGGVVVVLAQTPVVAPRLTDSSPALVIGFVGGFVHSDDLRHSEVQIARQIQATYTNGVQVQLFENRRTEQARKLVLDWLSVGNGKLTDDEKRGARLILFGHSWGASAVVNLARELQQNGIPVSLTIQVDSIGKNGENDSVIPANVAEAVNFYQTGGILHGRSRISAADPSRTRILGNFRFAYEKEPAECRAYPWYDRLLFKGHTAIECDPRVWSQVEALIRMRLPPILQSARPQVAARFGN